jgi:hypothetical protein
MDLSGVALVTCISRCSSLPVKVPVHGRGLADLSIFDGTEHSVSFVQVQLFDVHIADVSRISLAYLGSRIRHDHSGVRKLDLFASGWGMLDDYSLLSALLVTFPSPCNY